MRTPTKMVTTAAAVLVLGAVLAACSSSSSSSTPAGSASATVPSIAPGDFTADFAVMTQLKDLAASGDRVSASDCRTRRPRRGTCSTTCPLPAKAFETAGLTSDQFKIDNAEGSASTMQTQADADINAGATVLLIDPLDPGQRRGDRGERRVARASR